MPSRAESFFNELVEKDNGFEYLKSLPSQNLDEGEWLEVKRGSITNYREIRKIWSEALSGFANTEGGVLIWGLVADNKNSDGVDRIHDIDLCADVEFYRQTLSQNLHDVCDPPIPGVKVQTFTEDGKSGFVVCYIPEGTTKPYRAELDKTKPIYIRVGGSFIVPNLSLLRSLFYSRQAPVLVPVVHCVSQKRTCSIRLELHNKGVGSAEDTFVHVMFSEQFMYQASNFPECDTEEYRQSLFGIYYRRNIHPGSFARLIELRSVSRDVLENKIQQNKPLAIRVKTFCRHTEPRSWEIDVDSYVLSGVTKYEMKPYMANE